MRLARAPALSVGGASLRDRCRVQPAAGPRTLSVRHHLAEAISVKTDRDAEYLDYVQQRLPSMRRLAIALCGDQARADDLVQQALMSLYVYWRRVRGLANADAYLRKILVRAHLSDRRTAWARLRRSLMRSRVGGGLKGPGRAVPALGQRLVVGLRVYPAAKHAEAEPHDTPNR